MCLLAADLFGLDPAAISIRYAMLFMLTTPGVTYLTGPYPVSLTAIQPC